MGERLSYDVSIAERMFDPTDLLRILVTFARDKRHVISSKLSEGILYCRATVVYDLYVGTFAPF